MSLHTFSATKLDDSVVSLSDFSGRVVVVVNTATMWGTTTRDFRHMNELCQKVGNTAHRTAGSIAATTEIQILSQYLDFVRRIK